MYALFAGDKQIGQPFPTEMEVWENAMKEGLVSGQILPKGYHVDETKAKSPGKPIELGDDDAARYQNVARRP